MITTIQTVIPDALDALNNCITEVGDLDDSEVKDILSVIDRFSRMMISEVNELKKDESKINASLHQRFGQQQKLKADLEARQGKISKFPFENITMQKKQA